jgi:hypothetical protein
VPAQFPARSFRPVVRFLKAAFRLAGEDDLARRLTPAIRRIKTGEVGDETEEVESPAAEPSTPAAPFPEAQPQSP